MAQAQQHTQGESGDHVVEFDDPHTFVSAVLVEAGRGDLLPSLRAYPGRSARVATEVLAALEVLGGTVEVRGLVAAPEDFGRAGFLVPGSRVHVRLRSTLWQSFLVLVPVVAAAVATGGVALALLSATPVLGVLTANSARLTESERLVYVGLVTQARVAGGAVPVAEIRAVVPRDAHGDEWPNGAFEAALNRLVGMGAVADTERGFRPVL
jgi:hypothetical protein